MEDKPSTVERITSQTKSKRNDEVYDQTIETINGEVWRATCTCYHGTMYPGNWEEGKAICWHLQEQIKKIKEAQNEKTIRNNQIQ
jgi:hypothetical protein